MLYENTISGRKWWILRDVQQVYTWTQKPLKTKTDMDAKIRKANESPKISGTVLFGNDQFCSNLRFIGDLIQGNATIKRVITSKASSTSFLVGQFCDAIGRQNVVPSVEKTDSSHQGLEFLFSPLLEEYYNPTHDQAEENNNDQAPNASFQEAEFINPFCTQVQEIGEPSSRNIDNTNVHSFQPQSHDYRWTRDHPLEQVHGNPTMPYQTR
ncbi:hypothetical protein Tco_1353801 [Tanacetum coccineum]